MMRILRSAVLTVAALLLPGAVDAQMVPHRANLGSLTNDLDSNAGLIAAHRYELELRRAPAPRLVTAAAALHAVGAACFPEFTFYLLRGCEAGVIECQDFLGDVERFRDQCPTYLHDSTSSALISVRKLAARQGLALAVRRALYLQALRDGAAAAGGVEIRTWEAADRILAERHFDLLPEVEKAKLKWPRMDWDALKWKEDFAQALRSPCPRTALLELVRRAVTADVRLLLATDEEHERLRDAHGNAIGAASLALIELRRSGSAETAEELKLLLRDYAAVTEKRDLEWKQEVDSAKARGDAPPPEWQKPSPRPFAGGLWQLVVETIGDLGDREFERHALGGRCLWDQVNEVEKVLVTKKRLPRAQMVSE